MAAIDCSWRDINCSVGTKFSVFASVCIPRKSYFIMPCCNYHVKQYINGKTDRVTCKQKSSFIILF